MTDRLKVEGFVQELARTGEAKLGYAAGWFLQESFGQRVREAFGRDAEGHPAVTVAALARASALGTQPVFVVQALQRALNGVNYNPWRPRRSSWP